MARIGKQIPHFREINVSSIKADFSPDRLYRYTLYLEYSESLDRVGANEKLCVILKNPSSADELKADNTIRKVETYVYKHFPKVKFLCILNMFAIRATDVKEVNQLLKENNANYIVGQDNDKFINKVFAESDHIVFAWGNNNGIRASEYLNRVNTILQFGINSGKQIWNVEHPKGSKQPLHGLMWGFEYKIKKFCFVNDSQNQEKDV